MSTKHVFTTMDALRGVAALLVVVYHAGTSRIPGGYLAVDLFFALSGFVLAYNYSGMGRGLTAVSDFMRKRIIRLYPLYIIALGVGALVYFVTRFLDGNLWMSKAVVTLGANALFLPAPPSFALTWHLYPLNPPAWSLWSELLVNLAFALLIPFMGKRLLIGAIGVGAVAVVIAAFAHDSLNGGVRTATAWIGLARVTFSFFAGVAIFRIWASGRLKISLNPWAAALVLFLILMAPASGDWIVLRDLIAVLIVLPFLVAASTSNRKSATLSYLGQISYALYVIHTPILYALNYIGERTVDLSIKEAGLMGPVILVAVCLPIAAGLDRIDGPLRRLINRLIPGGRTSRAEKPREQGASSIGR